MKSRQEQIILRKVYFILCLLFSIERIGVGVVRVDARGIGAARVEQKPSPISTKIDLAGQNNGLGDIVPSSEDDPDGYGLSNCNMQTSTKDESSENTDAHSNVAENSMPLSTKDEKVLAEGSMPHQQHKQFGHKVNKKTDKNFADSPLAMAEVNGQIIGVPSQRIPISEANTENEFNDFHSPSATEQFHISKTPDKITGTHRSSNKEEHQSSNDDTKSADALVLAAMNGDSDSVKHLIENSDNSTGFIDAVDKNQWTALTRAAERKNKAMVKQLIELGANVNARGGPRGWAPIHYVIANGDIGTLKFLLEQKAKQSVKINYDNDPPDTPPSQTPLILAVRGNNIEVVKQLIENGADPNEKDLYGATAFHFAAKEGYVNIVKLLIEKGADVSIKVNYDDDESGTPPSETGLMLASRNGHTDVMQLLLAAKGVDVNDQNVRGSTALHFTALHGKTAAANLLVEFRADVKIKNRFGWTPLHFAARNGHVEIMALLLSKGANISTEASCAEPAMTPLMLASANSRTRAMKLLIDLGVDVNERTNKAFTPLHFAAIHGKINAVKVLIEMKADVNAKNRYDWTPLHYAAKYGHAGIIKLLVEKGAKVGAKGKFSNDRPGTAPSLTALTLAARNGHVEAVKELLASGAGANLNEKDSTGQTAVEAATKNGFKQVEESLTKFAASN